MLRSLSVHTRKPLQNGSTKMAAKFQLFHIMEQHSPACVEPTAMHMMVRMMTLPDDGSNCQSLTLPDGRE